MDLQSKVSKLKDIGFCAYNKFIIMNHFHCWYIPIIDVTVPHAPTIFGFTVPG